MEQSHPPVVQFALPLQSGRVYAETEDGCMAVDAPFILIVHTDDDHPCIGIRRDDDGKPMFGGFGGGADAVSISDWDQYKNWVLEKYPDEPIGAWDIYMVIMADPHYAAAASEGVPFDIFVGSSTKFIYLGPMGGLGCWHINQLKLV